MTSLMFFLSIWYTERFTIHHAESILSQNDYDTVLLLLTTIAADAAAAIGTDAFIRVFWMFVNLSLEVSLSLKAVHTWLS